MIEVESVTKVYELTARQWWLRKRKESKTAVKDLSLQIDEGEIVGLLGLNGAGKTTTIKMLSTLLKPTSGTIRIDGLDVERHRREIQARVNMIAGGERMIYWRLTGRENLTYFGRLYGLKEAEVERRTGLLLAEVGLEDAADIPVEKYSKGMKQRLQIARGLMNNPSYLFLDEPTLGLDAPIARHLRKLVKNLAKEQGKGILLTSHYLQEVEELCDRVYVIDHGKVLLCDTPSAVIERVAGFQVLTLQLSGWMDNLDSMFMAEMGLTEDTLSVVAQDAVDKVDATMAKGNSIQGESDRGDVYAKSVQLTVKTSDADSMMPIFLSWFARHGVSVHAMNVEKPTLEDAIVQLAEGRAARGILARVSS